MEVQVDKDAVKGLDPLDLLGHSLGTSLKRAISDKQIVEQRWVEDLMQYLGMYSDEQLQKMKADERSNVFLNITRVMVNQSVAQLADLLFPTDDKNYGVNATPNPTIDSDLKNHTQVQIDGQDVVHPEDGTPVTHAEVAARARAMAQEKADAMEREITDQLVECDHAGQARKALRWGAIFGTTIMAGPIAHTVTRHKMNVVEDKDGKDTVVNHETRTDRKPYSRAVAPWDFYPDMSGSTIREAEFTFERGYMTKKQLRLLAKRNNSFIKENIGKCITGSARPVHFTQSGNVDLLRRLTNVSDQTVDNRYEVWTYHGPVSKACLIAAGVKMDPDDPLDEFDGIVVFCGGYVLKVALNPLETEDWPYSVWSWAEDDFCIFGYGVPWLCRNEQAIVNTAWRMMLDNSSKAAGPQVVVKRGAVEPADGQTKLTPWKTWYADDSVQDVRNVFSVFTFPSVQTEIGNILQLARQFAQETGGLPPQVGQGQGQMPNTLGGTAMMMNSSNTDRRRQVRDWDDCVTKPMITRFYHWNMQYNNNNDIKGDFEVEARGTSALLLREQQAINLMAVLDKYAAHPVLQGALKSEAALRKVIQALHISPDELVKTPAEMEADSVAEAKKQPAEDPMIVVEKIRSEQIQARADSAREIAQLKADLENSSSAEERQLRRDLAVMDVQKQDRELQLEALRLAQSEKISYQKILADLKKSRWKLNLDSSKFQQELAVKKSEGETANYGLE